MQSPLGLLAVALRHRTWPRRGASILVRPAVWRPSRSLGRWFTAYSDCRSMAPAPGSARPGRAIHELQCAAGRAAVAPDVLADAGAEGLADARLCGHTGPGGSEFETSGPCGRLAELRNGAP